jgi:hypothetical protein
MYDKNAKNGQRPDRLKHADDIAGGIQNGTKSPKNHLFLPLWNIAATDEGDVGPASTRAEPSSVTAELP